MFSSDGLADLRRSLPTWAILFHISSGYLGQEINASVLHEVEIAIVCLMCVSRCTLKTLSRSKLSAELDHCMNNFRILTKLKVGCCSNLLGSLKNL